MANIKDVTILLAEDDPGHARLIERNLRRASINNDIHTVADGQQALDYLFCEGEYADRKNSIPLMVLLDLNMPVLDGYQVLKNMKQDNRTKSTPVIVLTTTDDAREVTRCYDLGCNVYVTKPVEYEQFSEAIRKLGMFLMVAVIPDKE